MKKIASNITLFRIGTIVMVAAMIVITGLTWRGGSMFDSDFSWKDSSYAAEQIFDSTSYQIREELESDNQLMDSEGEDSQEESPDLASDGTQASLADTGNENGNDLFTPGADGDGTGGGRPTGNGNGVVDDGGSGGGGSGTGPGPEGEKEPPLKGDANRVKDEQSSNADDIAGIAAGKITRFEMNGDHETKVMAGGPVNPDDVIYNDMLPNSKNEEFGYKIPLSAFSAQDDKGNSGGGLEFGDMKIADSDATARLTQGVQNYVFVVEYGAANTEPSTDPSGSLVQGIVYLMKSPTSKIVDVPIHYQPTGFTGRSTSVVAQICDKKVSITYLKNVDGAPVAYTYNDMFAEDAYDVPEPIWRSEVSLLEKNSDGTLKQIFPGWSVGGVNIGSHLAVDRAGTYTLKRAAVIPVPSNMKVRLTEGHEVELFGIDDIQGPISDRTLRIPEGITSINLEGAQQFFDIERLVLPATLKSVDLASVYRVFPNLKRTELDSETGSFLDADGILVHKGSNGWTMQAVPPKYENREIFIPNDVKYLADDAFDFLEPTVIEQSHLQFENPEVVFEDWDALKEVGMDIVPPYMTHNDELAFCRYLYAAASNDLADKVIPSRSAQGLRGAGSDYRFQDESIFYAPTGATSGGGAGTKILCYVGPTVSGMKEIGFDVSGIGKDAFFDTRSLTSLVIPDTAKVVVLENDSLASPSLSMVVIQNAAKISYAGRSAFGAKGSEALDGANLTVYIKCAEGSSHDSALISQLRSRFDDPVSHRVCVGDDEELIPDPSTGALYKRVDGNLALYSVPVQAAQPFAFMTDTKAILAGAFTGCANIKSVIIPSSVERVEDGAFAACPKLEIVYSAKPFDEGAVDEGTCLNLKLVALGDPDIEPDAGSDPGSGGDAASCDAFYRKVGGDWQLAALSSDVTGNLALRNNTVSIGRKAAMNCVNLFSLNNAGAVRTVEDSAFENCAALSSLDPFGRLSSIGTNAFKACGLGPEVTVRGDDLVIGSNAFADCMEMTKLNVTGTVLSLSMSSTSTPSANTAGAFSNCKRLQTVQLGEGAACRIESTGAYAFAGCSSLSEVIVAGSVQDIGTGMFKGCGSLGHFTVEDPSDIYRKLKVIGDEAFMGCGFSVFPINHFERLETIGASAFQNGRGIINLVLPKTMRSIGANAFAGSRVGNIKMAAELPSGAVVADELVIGSSAFADCSSLTSVDMTGTPASLEIESSAFAGCSELVEVSLSSRVASIGSASFANCTSLCSLSLQDTTVVPIAPDAFSGVDRANLIVEVPASEDSSIRDAYRADTSPWKAAMTVSGQSYVHNIVATSITYSGSTLVRMSPDSSQAAVVVSSQTTIIAPRAFEDCVGLKTVVIPSSVTEIGLDAFAGCTNLEAMVFTGSRPPQTMPTSLFGGPANPNGNFAIYVIGGATNWFGSLDVFEHCPIVVAGTGYVADMQEGTVYSDYADGCRKLLHVPRTFEGNLTVNINTDIIASGAAQGCVGLKTVDLKNNVSLIDTAAFKGCTSLDRAYIHNSNLQKLARLGESAFEGCSSLKGFWYDGQSQSVYTLAFSITKFGTNTFKGCTALAQLNIQGAVERIPEGFVSGCTSLTQVGGSETYLRSVRSFGANAFAGCVAMTTTGASLLTFEALTEIGPGAYAGCTNLALAVFPPSLETIGADAFAGCGALDAIAFNGNNILNLAGSGLSDSWRTARVFVPTGMKDAFTRTWDGQGVGQPFLVKDISTSYRAISGNIFAQYDIVSASKAKTVFLSTTQAAIAANPSGTVAIYSTANMPVTAIADDALSGVAGIDTVKGSGSTALRYVERIGERAFKDCTDLTSMTGTEIGTLPLEIGASAFEGCINLGSFKVRGTLESIGMNAFSGVKDGFVLDATSITSPFVLGERVFGEELPSGLRIAIGTDIDLQRSFVEKWGPRLAADYGLDAKGVEGIFGITDATVKAYLAQVLANAEANGILDGGALGANGANGASGDAGATSDGQQGSDKPILSPQAGMNRGRYADEVYLSEQSDSLSEQRTAA